LAPEEKGKENLFFFEKKEPKNFPAFGCTHGAFRTRVQTGESLFASSSTEKEESLLTSLRSP
jgi:hypothetical protein